MEIAQEEVLNCVGMCIYDRLKKIHQCVREEENACQVLGAVAVYALCRSFDMVILTFQEPYRLVHHINNCRQ